MSSRPTPVVTDGTLVIRHERRGSARAVCLCGELDLANADTAARELEAALAESPEPLVIDLSRLEFIDSSGIALIVSVLGREQDAGRIGFVPATAPAVNRVLDLTGISERLPLA